ncbi:VOC family protein [Labilibacter sediminis]|nr:VOC family protein [Labilibacter sediminis]
MPSVNIYLTFNGNCEEAFNYYKSVLGGELQMLSRFKEMPPDDCKKLPEEDLEKIMHVSLPVGKETVLMGSDAGGEWAKGYKHGNNFSVSVSADSMQDADLYFEKLSAEGVALMPMDKTFWGSYFGMLTDKYGINWMISFDQNSE